MYNIPDHPVIRNMELTGYPDGREPEYPHCPACYGSEIQTLYKATDGDILGCESCVTRKSEETNEPCPICGQLHEYRYYKDKEWIGCDECVTEENPWEIEECFR